MPVLPGGLEPRLATVAPMPTRWLIVAALLTGLAILIAGAVFFTLAARDTTAGALALG